MIETMHYTNKGLSKIPQCTVTVTYLERSLKFFITKKSIVKKLPTRHNPINAQDSSLESQ